MTATSQQSGCSAPGSPTSAAAIATLPATTDGTHCQAPKPAHPTRHKLTIMDLEGGEYNNWYSGLELYSLCIFLHHSSSSQELVKGLFCDHPRRGRPPPRIFGRTLLLRQLYPEPLAQDIQKSSNEFGLCEYSPNAQINI